MYEKYSILELVQSRASDPLLLVTGVTYDKLSTIIQTVFMIRNGVCFLFSYDPTSTFFSTAEKF